MPDDSGLILDNFRELKNDLSKRFDTLENKLDSYSTKTERLDARLESLEKRSAEFVPASVLNERRSAYEQRLTKCEVKLDDMPKQDEQNRKDGITRFIAILAAAGTLLGVGINWFPHSGSQPQQTTNVVEHK